MHRRRRSVSRASLTALSSLARFDLRGNQLATLFPEVLRPLASLRAIDLSGNRFESLPLLELEHVEGTLESVSFEGRKYPWSIPKVQFAPSMPHNSRPFGFLERQYFICVWEALQRKLC